jgi:hypothetical protein
MDSKILTGASALAIVVVVHPPDWLHCRPRQNHRPVDAPSLLTRVGAISPGTLSAAFSVSAAGSTDKVQTGN